MRNEEILHTVKEEGDILYAIKIRKACWIGYIPRRKCLLKYIIEGKIEERIQVMGRRGGRRKQLLDDLNEKRECCELKKETIRTALFWTVTE